MDVKAGTTVGFITVLGGAAGGLFGALIGGMLDVKDARVPIVAGGLGALLGAFVGGTIVAPGTVVNTGTAKPQLPAGATQ